MATAALAAALLALLVALIALARANAQKREREQASDGASRGLENLGEELRAREENLRKLVAELAGGGKLTRDMVLEGRLWRDASPAEGMKMVQEGGVRLVDVRTPQETAGGIIPGAILIPIDELEARQKEIPRDGKRTLIYCAGGGRSSAACEHLSGAGWTELYNLEGGFNSWTGPRAKP